MTDSPVPLAAHPHPDLSIDQQLALRTAATRLHSEFGEHFGVETIERLLHSSYDQFAGRATVPNFLPLLAERWARQTTDRPGTSRGQDHRRQAHRAVLVHAQCWPLPDGAGVLQPPCRR
jgi:hypothetical protein